MAAHKLQLMVHSPKAYAALGRLTADARATPGNTFAERYADTFMTALSVVATPARHVNVLQHMAGYFKRALDPASKVELADAIEDYRQVHLEPHPKELMLRNHI